MTGQAPRISATGTEMTFWTLRTADEILHRFRVAGDPFGWERETLVPYLTWDEATTVVGDTEEAWAEFSRPRTIKRVAHDARVYLDYSWLRALRHRNIPAQRSMCKMSYWCWLLGADVDRFAPDDNEARGTYCVRALAAAAAYLDVPFPPTHTRETIDQPRIALTDDQRSRLSRMYAGKPCTPDCPDGCIYDDTSEHVQWPTT